MLLGITLSNLSGDQKILKAKNIFLPNFAEYLSSSTRQKKICREPGSRHSAKYPLCRVPGGGTRQRLDAISPPTGVARRARVLGTCAGFAECHSLPTAGTRQSSGMPCGRCLPSARVLALGKAHLCRVSVFWYSAKAKTLGKFGFSGSDIFMIFFSN